MFLHHTMTDPEILRSCEGCTSPHLRLVADRLRERVAELREINGLAVKIVQSSSAVEIGEMAATIGDLSGEV